MHLLDDDGVVSRDCLQILTKARAAVDLAAMILLWPLEVVIGKLCDEVPVPPDVLRLVVNVPNPCVDLL